MILGPWRLSLFFTIGHGPGVSEVPSLVAGWRAQGTFGKARPRAGGGRPARVAGRLRPTIAN